MKVLVIGGTLYIGRLLVEELVKAGHEVAILHRKPKHDFGRRVENLMADRNDPDSLREVLSGRRFEVIYDNAYDWERGTTAAQVEATVQACGGNRLSRYIFMSSVAAYGDGLNHKESDPLAPDYHANPYIRFKASTERQLFRMYSKGLPVVTFRPPFIFGPGNPFYREQFFWDRLRAGRPIIIPGDGHRLMQFVYVNDLVHALVRALEEPRAVGEAFNIADPKPLTQVEFVERLAKIAGVEPVLVRVPRDVIQQAGGNAMDEPYYFGEYLDVPPITENIGKVTRVLKMKLTPFDIALKETFRWYTRNHRSRTPGFDFDDKILAMAKASSPASV